MRIAAKKSRKSRLNSVIICAVIALCASHPTLANPRIYSDQQLFEIGKEKFEADKMREAAAYLFAYIQRQPKRMKNAEHSSQVEKAYNWAVGYDPGALTSGDLPTSRKPTLTSQSSSKRVRDYRKPKNYKDSQENESSTQRPPNTGSGSKKVITASNSKVAKNNNQQGKPGLDDLLRSRQWENARDETWSILIEAGDKNGDGVLSYAENDDFPCRTLLRLSDKWKANYGSSFGYDDILMPRFRNRFLSCGFWSG